MIAMVWTVTALLMMSTFVSYVAPQETNDYDYEALLNEIPEILPYIANKEVSSFLTLYSKL